MLTKLKQMINKVVKVTPTEKVEGIIIAAYFAKEEYTIKTDEKVGTQYYRFKNEQKKVSIKSVLL